MKKNKILSFVLITIIIVLNASAVMAASQSFVLSDGFNFLGLEVVPAGLTSKTILTSSESLVSVFVYDKDSQNFKYQLKLGNGTILGNDLDITAGQGFIVKTDGGVSLQVDGDTNSSISYELAAGFNLIGTPALSKTVSAKTLLTSLDNIESIFKWNITLEKFDFIIKLGNGTILGNDYNLEDGKGYFIKSTDSSTISLEGTNTPVVALSSISISKTADSINSGATYDFGTLTTTATYSDQMNKTVTATWSSTTGSFTGNVYTHADGATTAIITATYVEGGVTKTTDFTLTIVQSSGPVTNGAITDITISSFSKKVLIAINANPSETGVAEAAGALPANSVASMPKLMAPIPRGPKKVYDRYIKREFDSSEINRFPQPAKAISHTTTNHTFMVYDQTNQNTINVAATLKYGTSTSKCLMYLADSTTNNAAWDWNGAGTKFDNLYTMMVNTYGAPTDIDGNGQVVVLYFDMISVLSANETNTVGYFDKYDIEGDANQGSNRMEVFYMNINWSGTLNDPGAGELFPTLFHEFQHMINAGYRITNSLPAMETWIDEGLAMAAMQLTDNNTAVASNVNVMLSDESNLIRNGAPLTVWKGNENNGSEEAYTISYVFIQYLKNQSADGAGLFKRMIQNANGDYKNVESVMSGANTYFSSFRNIVAAWKIANLVNGDGIYGYGAEKTQFNFSQGAHPSTSNDNVNILPGGGVYVYPSSTDLTNFTPASQGTNIHYIRINK